METTRKNNFGRILVVVLDPKLLPPKLDVVIGDHYFELKFEFEPVGFDENGDEVCLNFGDNDDNQDMDEDHPNEEHNSERDGNVPRMIPILTVKRMCLLKKIVLLLMAARGVLSSCRRGKGRRWRTKSKGWPLK